MGGNPKYSDRYDDKPIGYEFGEGMVKLGDISSCTNCLEKTRYFDLNFKEFLCSDKCRGDFWLTYARTHLSGYFRNYLVLYKNKDHQRFPDVFIWFKGRYLYYQQLDIPEKPKGRIDTYEIVDIQPGEKYEP